MNNRHTHHTFIHLLGAVAIVAGALVTTACNVKLCRAPSHECPCQVATDGKAALVVLTDHASPAFTAAIDRLTEAGGAAFKGNQLGLGGVTPVVILTTYRADGTLNVVGRFNLAGDGDSASRIEANAELATACLRAAAKRIPYEGAGGNLLRALPEAIETAEARGGDHPGLLLIGFGRSSGDHIDMDQIDLGTPQAQAHVVDVLRDVAVLEKPAPVAVTILKPGEGVENLISKGHIEEFAQGPFCAALAENFCKRVEVLR